jgi:hypothetical protein
MAGLRPIVLAAAVAMSGPAAASGTSLCDFVMGVLEAKSAGFEPLKGEAQNPAVFHYEVFHGAVLPNGNAICTLFLKTRAGRVTLPARYSCTIAQADEFADANRLFQRALAELKACLPRAAFGTKYDGDGRDPDGIFDWTAEADQPGYKLTLEMSNGLQAAAAALAQNDPNAPRIAIDLDVTDTSEEH